MKLDDSRRSDNVEDERGSGGGFRGVHLGIVGTLVVVGIGYFMGISPSTMLSLLNGGGDRAVTFVATGGAENGGSSSGRHFARGTSVTLRGPSDDGADDRAGQHDFEVVAVLHRGDVV